MHRYSRRDAAAYVAAQTGRPCSANTLSKYATVGGGPRFRKFGIHVLYEQSDLDQWIESRLSPPVSSSSELAQLREQAA